jgi:hypothetical protein
MKKPIDIGELAKAVKESLTIYEVYTRLHISRTRIREAIKQNEITTTHFTKHGKRVKRIPQHKICPVCNKEFIIKRKYDEKKVTCSHSCANKYFRTGKDHPNWSDDISSSSVYRRVCFKIHEPKCVVCGEHNTIDVHHIDGNHNNNTIQNLIPLCPTHHRYMHIEELKPLIEEKVLSAVKY